MRIFLTLILVFITLPAFSQKFQFSFTWAGLMNCTTGNPNRVQNPEFTLKNVPKGTKWIYFKLVDLDVRSYNHGGGWVEYTGQSSVEPGAFKYKSPCPPTGKHKYQWTASAKTKKSSFGGTIESATASKMYP